MLRQVELIKGVAERCGISPEVSNYFFDIFINRLGNKLKPGEVMQFYTLGYFQKRHCRVPSEKTDSKSSEGSSLFPLIMFSDDPEIQNDLKSFSYFSIPDLKTLWENDKDFESSLKAGDFSPYNSRSQLINSFATKAEVIINGLVKLDKVFEEEFVFPFGFKPKFKESTATSSYYESDNISTGITQKPKSTESNPVKEADVTQEEKKEKESEASTLPWNIGKKFYDKKVDQPAPEDFKSSGGKGIQSKSDHVSKQTLKGTDDSHKKIDAEEALDAAIQESESDENLTRFKEFQPVKSRLSGDDRNKMTVDDQPGLRIKKKPEPSEKSENFKTVPKFTEVKSKTEVYHLQNDVKKLKKKQKFVDEPFAAGTDTVDKYKSYRGNKNLFPIILIFSVILIGAVLVYFYLIEGVGTDSGNEKVVLTVTPPPSVKIIERDFEFTVTYPYTKSENEIPIEGINPDAFLTEEVAAIKKEEQKPEKTVEPPVAEKKAEVKPEEPPKVEQKVEPEVMEQKSSRIFIYNNYFVVFVGSYSSYTAADRAAEKYFDEGYNAFIEVEEIPGKPTRYNLNVGDFTSEEFARQFQDKYIKK
jgi:nucleoid DNA-binding protein